MKRDDPVCPACSKLIELGMPVSFQHGDLLHRWCYEARAAAPKKPAKAVTPAARSRPRRS